MNCDNGYVVPPAQWKWCGYAGHFIAADSCRFRMCTQVGDWLISSVGDMLDSKGKRQRIGAGEDAYFETCVFKAGPICSVRGCGCGQPTIDGHELDSRRCGTGGEAQALHMAFCEKYARGGTPEDDTSMTKEGSMRVVGRKPLIEVLHLQTVREQLISQGFHVPLHLTASLERTRQAILQLGAARIITPAERERLHKRFEKNTPEIVRRQIYG